MPSTGKQTSSSAAENDDEKLSTSTASLHISSTTGSTISTTTSASPSSNGGTRNINNYYQRRFNGSTRRSQLIEKLSRNNNNNNNNNKDSNSAAKKTSTNSKRPNTRASNVQYVESGDVSAEPLSPPSLKPSKSYIDIITTEYASDEDDAANNSNKIDDMKSIRVRLDCIEKKSTSTHTNINNNDNNNNNNKNDNNINTNNTSINNIRYQSFSIPDKRCDQRQPLHLMDNIKSGQQHNPQRLQHDGEREEMKPIIRYYRIVYRGVVALLSNNRKKSGKYLGFGEIIASSNERLVEDVTARVQKITSNSLKRNHTSSPHRLGSAVDSPSLANVVWESEQQQQQYIGDNERQIQIPSSLYFPPRSLITTTDSVSSIDIYRTASTTTSQHQTASAPIKMRKVIRVDRVLTGGYAFDAKNETSTLFQGISSSLSSSKSHFLSKSNNVGSSDMTPKRGNVQYSSLTSVCSSSLPIPDANNIINSCTKANVNRNIISTRQVPAEDDAEKNEGIHDNSNHNNCYHECIFSEQSNVLIAVPLDIVPICEQGSFTYRVISSTPVPILMGPCLDAPSTKGMLIPGTIHEICVRVLHDENIEDTKITPNSDSNSSVSISFLRLTRRRGWVADKKIIQPRNRQNVNQNNKERKVISDNNSNLSWIPLLKEIANEEVGECGLSVTSNATSGTIMSSTLVTPTSVASRRHRPPRRKRCDLSGVNSIGSTPLPRHVMGPSLQHRHNASNNNHDTSTITDSSTSMNNSQHHDPRIIMSPSSNISLLSDDTSSLDLVNRPHGGTLSPERSVTRSTASSSVRQPIFFLMRVNAPRGLKILDAPHFQVNNLIHGSNETMSSGIFNHNHAAFSSSTSPSTKDIFYGKTGNQSIFQTMTGHHTTTMTSKISNPAIFDSITKSRKLPRGTVFEATKRLEASNAFSEGAGLIKLSDNSGWAIVPRKDELNDQYRSLSGALAYSREGEAKKAYEEVGNSTGSNSQDSIFLRVLSRGGVSISLPPAPNIDSDVGTSPASSTVGSSVISSTNGLPLLKGGVSQESDVASSVGSSFLDSMFRTPKKGKQFGSNESKGDHHNLYRAPTNERHAESAIISCGTCVEVDRWVDPPDMDNYLFKNEFARVRGGQGWIPRFVNGKPVVETVKQPEFRFGSFWFRVKERRGIKVRLGPSRRASSIRSEDGVYFRFECGEFLRASEVVTFFRHNSVQESFAKLYRNRHVRLHTGDLRPLSSLTTQAEWVQVFGGGVLLLDECATEPRIVRHKQGWRYNVVLDARITIRKGPSFEAETDGMVLLGGESILVNERVTGPDDSITWLRLKDGPGWAHNIGMNGEALMIPHSLRHRMAGTGRPKKARRSKQEDIAYNTIIARLFHNEVPGDSPLR